MSSFKDSLYPKIEPYQEGLLDVDGLHKIYWEVSGNPEGVPVVILHGGPGGYSSPFAKRFFDPKYHKIIQFDQRGCGKSMPTGELKDNTTEYLISDMEVLRNHLEIDKWHVTGGSWGSTLSLAYAIAHPDKCLSLLIRGVFMMRDSEIDWFMHDMGNIFPEAGRAFIEKLPENERNDLLNNYYRRLTTGSYKEQQDHGVAWSNYESACAYFTARAKRQTPLSDAERTDALTIARLEAHYFLHNRFEPHDYILKNIDKIRQIPAIAIQGRYDIVCPVKTAYDLKQEWPELDLRIVNDAGHATVEEHLGTELLEAAHKLKSFTP